VTLDGLICTYARTTTSVQVYLRWPPGRSVRSRAASTRRRRPLRHENDCWLRLLAHVWMGFASFFVSALTRSWATGLKFYGLQRYSLKISFGQGGPEPSFAAKAVRQCRHGHLIRRGREKKQYCFICGQHARTPNTLDSVLPVLPGKSVTIVCIFRLTTREGEGEGRHDYQAVG